VIDISYNAARDIDDIGTPDVRVEGFRNVKDLGNSDSLLCFSFYYPLARLNPNSLFIADSTHDFNEAIDKYRKLSDSGLGSCSFIAVPASLYHSKNAIFYLAFLNPAKEILLDDEVAKDLINNPGKR
jgi:hypothetical protein